MPAKKTSSFWMYLFALIAAVMAAAGIYHLASQTKVPPKDMAKLQSQANVANGRLENDQYDAAEETYVALIHAAGDDELPYRNLAICRLLAFETPSYPENSTRDQQEALKRAKAGPADEATTSYAEKFPESAVAQWLLGRFQGDLADDARPSPDPAKRASAEDHQQASVAAYAAATDLDPSNLAYWYALYSRQRLSQDESVQVNADQALAQAHQLAPGNLFLLRDYLLSLAQQEDSALVAALEQAAQATRPFHDHIQQTLNINFAELLDQANKAATAGDWSTAVQRARVVQNILAPYAREDARRCMPHPLEFMLFTLSGQTIEPTAPEAIPITWESAADLGDLKSIEDAVAVRFADMDLDQRPELCVLRQARIEMYRRTKNGWELLAAADVPPGMNGMLLADLDRDAVSPSSNVPDWSPPKPDSNDTCHSADPDLVVYGEQGVLVLRNDLRPSGRALTPITNESLKQLRGVTTAALGDFDHDGDLDLATAHSQGVSLWSMGGAMQYEDASARSLLPESNAAINAMVACDFDNDVDLDFLLIGEDASATGWLENLRRGRFRWQTFEDAKFPVKPGVGIALDDSDQNATWDVIATGDQGVQLALTTIATPGRVTAKADSVVTDRTFVALRGFDYDNDGFLDLLGVGNAGAMLLRGQGSGYESVGLIGQNLLQVTDCHTADVDLDGDLDIALVTGGRITLLTNQGGNKNHYITLRLQGLEDTESAGGRVNHLGVGSLAEIRAGDSYQRRVVDGAATHFGVGDRAQVDTARIVWTNGLPQDILRPASDQTICEEMVLKGSCPYAYTFNGEKFVFFTDLLWASPIGLQLADGVLAHDRPTEYLLLPGDLLAPKDGAYEIRVTEELWEAAYFDQIELLAIDHPADIAIYSNEKVGPQNIAAMQVHAVANRRTPLSVKDSQGRERLPEVIENDNVFLRAFDRTIRQGLAPPHFIEIDFGPLPQDAWVTLFLTGWIRPTDTSLNVAISHDPAIEHPRPPSLQAIDNNGNWREVNPFVGFPGGKTKTIAIDVSDAFLSDDKRLRLMSSNELYWDEIFFSVDEEPAPWAAEPLELLSADLHYRGTSAIALQPGKYAPDVYDYDRVNAEAKWPPMSGFFTRYGDVKSLLTTTDDRLLVIGAGDEAVLRFKALPPPPKGWKRDFFLHNVGWDKDADLNTVAGQTVEPLPSVNMSGYPSAEPPPRNDSFYEYLREYQTRQQPRQAFWRRLAKPIGED